MLRTCVVRLAASRFTLSVRSFHVPATPGTTAWPPSLPSVPTSRATRITSEANARSCSTMVFMVSFTSRISPRTSTVILRDRSPPAMAAATSAMPRTCAVRLLAMKFTLSVRSFHVPPTPGTCACPPSLPSVPTSRATRVTSEANAFNWSTIVLMVFLSSRISPFTSTVILRDRSPRATAVVTSAMLRTCAVRLPAIELTLSVRPFHVPATPGTCAWPPSLPSVPTSRATRVTSEAKAFSWSTIVLMVFLSSSTSPDDVDRDLLRQVAVGDGGRHVGDVAHLRGQVRRQQVHVVGQVLPRAGDTGHHRLAAEAAVGADLARHARHFARERVELVDHRVERVLEREDLALHVDRDLARQVAARDGRGHFGDVAHLRGQVARHRVDASRSGPSTCPRHPGTCAWPPSLPSVPTSRATRVTSRRERVELVDHRVDGVLELEHFARDVDRDLARQVAARDRRRHFRDVAHLRGEVRREQVHVVGQVLPRAGHARHHRLAAEPAFGADLARHARDFGGERVELVDHRVERFLELQDLAATRSP